MISRLLILSSLLLCSTGFAQNAINQNEPKLISTFVETANPEQREVINDLSAINQLSNFVEGASALSNPQEKLKQSVDQLVLINKFYEPIGGLKGYNKTVSSMLAKKNAPSNAVITSPPFLDARSKNEEIWNICKTGCLAQPKSFELYVVGGAGDRLNLIDKTTGVPLPAAKLKFIGKTLLQRLFQDLEAREYWYFKTTGKNVRVPVVLMTSTEKNNDSEIEKMCKQSNWFGRPQDSIVRMIQPQVPLVDKEGRWVVASPLEFAMKPGGHGVVWKLGFDMGIFQNLMQKGIEYSLVRQINNPFVGLDNASFAMLGFGVSNKKAFGIATCPQRPGFAEGMIVLKKENDLACISNIEYTEFEALKKEKPELFKSESLANVNFLFANLSDIEQGIKIDPIPGMLVNAKTEVDAYVNGRPEKVIAARLESTMQNISDAFTSKVHEPVTLGQMKSFVELFGRDKIMSASKRAYVPEKIIQETPISCLYDWHKTNRSLLAEYAKASLPPEKSMEEFMKSGPEFFFDYHPALGPLWEVIAQKLRNITFKTGSELILNIAEVHIDGLDLDGSLVIDADWITGKPSSKGIQYSPNVGRVYFKNVTIKNNCKASSDLEAILDGTLKRKGCCTIHLQNAAEVFAENITIPHAFTLDVPPGMKAIIKNGPKGELLVDLQSCTSPSWQTNVDWPSGKAPLLTFN